MTIHLPLKASQESLLSPYFLHTQNHITQQIRAHEMMLSPSILPLSSNLTLPHLQRPDLLSVSLRPSSKSHVCLTFSPSNQGPIDDEARWLREEQRWLREEQRWLREESRWNAERLALLQEISSLKRRIQELEKLNSLQGASVSETVASMAKLLQVLKEGDLGKNINRIAESGSSSAPLVVEATEKEDEVVDKEVISIPDKKEMVKRRATLRKGSEGDEVKAMQEALGKLGFYSGEEDIEFSSFSDGTERAVKTWQSTIVAPEDGIMTAELLESLFGNSVPEMGKSQQQKRSDSKKNENGAPVAAITEISEVQQTVVTDEGVAEVGVSEHRVFLLGENRWEDSSRLSGSSKKTSSKGATGNSTTTKCRSCRGEGRLLCMECDGTGEPNIEPQFMEWIDEGTKCPYCEGLGFTPCDVCDGTKTN